MLFYAGKLISDSAPKGKRAVWNYGIPEVYVIVIMDGFRFPESREGHYLHDICLCNKENGEVFYEGLEFIYIELLNFVKTASGMETDLDRWLFLFKNISTLDSIPEAMRDNPVFERVFENAEYVKLTKKEKEMYDIELKRKWDRVNILASATKQARAEAKAEGKEEVVVNGWKNGFTIEQLCTLTGWEKGRITEVLKREQLL
jgi:predicted transposase/invertase (TIGR01784 family)